MNRSRRILIPLATMVALQACLYIPTPEHGLISGRAMIGNEEIEDLELGKTTRADVLLKFGDPSERLDDDAFFCYEWERVQGVVAVAGGASADVGKRHFFCVQFSEEGILVRAEHIKADLFGDAVKKKEEVLASWRQSDEKEKGITPQ